MTKKKPHQQWALVEDIVAYLEQFGRESGIISRVKIAKICFYYIYFYRSLTTRQAEEFHEAFFRIYIIFKVGPIQVPLNRHTQPSVKRKKVRKETGRRQVKIHPKTPPKKSFVHPSCWSDPWAAAFEHQTIPMLILLDIKHTCL